MELTDFIKKTVAEYYELKTEDLETRKRYGNLIKTKHIAVYFMKQYTRLSLRKIGLTVGGISHGAVLSAVKSVDNQRDTNCDYNNEVSHLEEKILNFILYKVPEIVPEKESPVFQESDFFPAVEKTETQEPEIVSTFVNQFADIKPHDGAYSGYREHQF